MTSTQQRVETTGNEMIIGSRQRTTANGIGITCWENAPKAALNGRVRYLQLDDNGLIGTVPRSILCPI